MALALQAHLISLRSYQDQRMQPDLVDLLGTHLHLRSRPVCYREEEQLYSRKI